MTPTPLGFLNGRLLPQSQIALAPNDAGFVFGATITDFCRTENHRLFRWPDHLARLRRDCETCFVPLPYTNAELTTAAEEVVRHNASELADVDDLALITFVTPGPLGYMIGEVANGPPTVGMHTFPLPKERYRRFFTEGITLTRAGKLPESFVPASVKHRSRMHWWMANQSSKKPDAVPMLIDERTGAVDTAIGAVLVVVDGEVYRSPRGTVLDSISLALAEEVCGRLGIRFAEGNVATMLYDAQEVLLVGTAFGAAGVQKLETRVYPWPGPVTLQLQAAYSAVGRSVK